MLDVHPPHEAAHTWKDFFIHIATIVVGLLIAVGLEQTVEAIHHHHVREELRRALTEDDRINENFVKLDLDWGKLDIAWALKQAAAIEHAAPNGPLLVELEPPGRFYVPNTGVWLTAKANGDAGLLSQPEQEWMTDLDRVEADIFVSDASALGHQKTAQSRLDTDLLGRQPDQGRQIDLTTMSPQQRAETADAFRSLAGADHVVQSRLLLYSTYLEFLLSFPSGETPNLTDEGTLKRFLDIQSKTLALHPDSAPTFAAKEN
jgi:hypothetical protein